MKKLTVFVILLSTLVIFGCNQAQKKPTPTKQTLIPKESTIGFSQIDTDELPASIQKVASTMEDRLMVTWAYDSNNSYILLNTAQDAENLKVNKVVQRVPVQDFLWLDVKLDYTDSDKAGDNNNSKLIVVKLDKTDKSINGVGFELKKASEENKAEANEKPQATPAPTPAPITRESANQTKTTQENIQLVPTEESSPKEEPTNKQSQSSGETQAKDKEKSTPAVPNGD